MSGWGGSVLAMIQSLKNNKMLLRGRRSFFRREMTYAELREYYKDSLEPISNDKKPSKSQLNEIRTRLKNERRDYNFFRISTTVSITLCLLVFIQYSYNNFTIVKKYFIESDNPNEVELMVIDQYQKHMKNAQQKFKSKNYFFALGEYKRALKIIPNDSIANIELARTYFRMCKYRGQVCEEAFIHAKEMLNKKPESKRLQKLSNYYSRRLGIGIQELQNAPDI